VAEGDVRGRRGKPVKVDALETIKRGGKACRFEVRLTA